MWSDLTLAPFKGQTRIAKLKTTYNSLILGPRGLQCETKLVGNYWAGNLMWSDLTLGPSFQLAKL